MPYVRTVKTKPGATAVQVVWSSRRGSRQIEHIGSAHDEAGLEARRAGAVAEAGVDDAGDVAGSGQGPLGDGGGQGLGRRDADDRDALAVGQHRQHSSCLVGSQPASFGMMILKFLRAAGQHILQARRIGAVGARARGACVLRWLAAFCGCQPPGERFGGPRR